jgi:hypothetical protein
MMLMMMMVTYSGGNSSLYGSSSVLELSSCFNRSSISFNFFMSSSALMDSSCDAPKSPEPPISTHHISVNQINKECVLFKVVLPALAGVFAGGAVDVGDNAFGTGAGAPFNAPNDGLPNDGAPLNDPNDGRPNPGNGPNGDDELPALPPPNGDGPPNAPNLLGARPRPPLPLNELPRDDEVDDALLLVVDAAEEDEVDADEGE